MCKEVWKKIKEFDGNYEVSNLGRIRSIDRIIGKKLFLGKIIKQSNNRGYKMVSLYKNSKSHGRLVHRLVALAFIENPNNHPDVNHKDLNKENNQLDNLEWVSEKQNTQHAIINGAMDFIFGEKNFKSILTADQIKRIRSEYWQTLLSTTDLALKYKVSKPCMVSIINNNNWYDANYQKFLDNKGKRAYRNIGSKNGACKLTELEVYSIRQRHNRGEGVNSLALEYGVSRSGIQKIVNRQTWKHI